MGFLDRIASLVQSKKESDSYSNKPKIKLHKETDIADASSISDDEKPYYNSDDYYTYYSFPGTGMGKRVITFEERKAISYPSKRGLYVAEILLLEYCSHGKYPKPSSGYPGLWWFEYGVRDIGHALESLEKRGYLEWASKKDSLSVCKVSELKSILSENGLNSNGKKAELIKRIVSEIDEDRINIFNYIPKYKLTELGIDELKKNAYVPYMHKHPYKTTEGDTFGEGFNVWAINRLFPDGETDDWKKTVGEIEIQRFGVDIVNSSVNEPKDNSSKENIDYSAFRDEMRRYLAAQKERIAEAVNNEGNPIDIELNGMRQESAGNDKEALVMYYISIGKKADVPALYREAAKLLRRYAMYDEELYVIDQGIRNVDKNNKHRDELIKRREKVLQLIQTEQRG